MAERAAGFLPVKQWVYTTCTLASFIHPSDRGHQDTRFSCFRLTLLSGNKRLYHHTGIVVYTCYSMYQSFQIISVHNCTLSL